LSRPLVASNTAFMSERASVNPESKDLADLLEVGHIVTG
jgi:hypothetical protein